MSLGLGLGADSSSYQDFDLTDVSDLSLWLKNNTNVAVARWDSSASVTNNASQSSEANQAALSGGGLDFDGINDSYELSSNIAIAENGGFCLAAVIQLEVVDNATIAADDSAAKAQISVVDGTSFKFRATDARTTTFVFPSGTFNTSKMLIMLNRTSGASNRFTFSKNGSPLTPDTDNSVNEAAGENPKPFDFVYMGAVNQLENFYNGKILELAFWSKSLNTTEQAAVNSYLQNIHGL
jgi:hypothetical protein